MSEPPKIRELPEGLVGGSEGDAAVRAERGGHGVETLQVIPVSREQCWVGGFDGVLAGGGSLRVDRQPGDPRGQGPEVGKHPLIVIRPACFLSREKVQLIRLGFQLVVSHLEIQVSGAPRQVVDRDGHHPGDAPEEPLEEGDRVAVWGLRAVFQLRQEGG